jgi:hypothetical protein
MTSISVVELIPVLQTAIGPMILVSGVGLLLLAMTNRLGRTIDRSRILAGKLDDPALDSRKHISSQLAVLWQRARLIRLAITLASMSALLAALLIILIFTTALLCLECAWLIGTLFVFCMAFLIASLVVFIKDINLTLVALKMELKGDLRSASDSTSMFRDF